MVAAQQRSRRIVPEDHTLRILALGTLVNRGGAGATVTTFALYFTRVVGLRATQVGLALSVGALVGMLVQLPAGQWGDVRGPREVMRILQIGMGLTGALLLVTRNAWLLIVAMALITATQSGANAVRNGYIARVATGGQGVAFKAYLRAVTNIAMAFGALLGGVALWIDRPWAYLSVFAIDAVTSVIAGISCGALPHLAPAPPRGEGEPRLAVLRDAPYVVVILLTGIVSMHFIVMEVGIPLWIAQHTHAPTQMVAVLLVLNTVAVSLFQVRLSRGTDTVPRAASSMVAGAVWIAVAFCLLAFSGRVSRWDAAAVLVVGASVHVVGEMITSSAQWGLSMGLAPTERQGQYQGFASLGFGISSTVAPTLITWLCIDWGAPGWFVLAAMILGAAALMPTASAWALRTRARYGAASATG